VVEFPSHHEVVLMWRFSQRSYDRMVGVRPELIAVATRALALSSVDFGISEGLRTPARQAQLVQAGASQTMKSRHLTGHAIDVVAYVGSDVRWDWPLYEAIARAMDAASDELRVPLEWGGGWTTLRDGPHYQLPWGNYPL
jgi:peptidoglycan LD-endopeptidase CwlK